MVVFFYGVDVGVDVDYYVCVFMVEDCWEDFFWIGV